MPNMDCASFMPIMYPCTNGALVGLPSNLCRVAVDINTPAIEVGQKNKNVLIIIFGMNGILVFFIFYLLLAARLMCDVLLINL